MDDFIESEFSKIKKGGGEPEDLDNNGNGTGAQPDDGGNYAPSAGYGSALNSNFQASPGVNDGSQAIPIKKVSQPFKPFDVKKKIGTGSRPSIPTT